MTKITAEEATKRSNSYPERRTNEFLEDCYKRIEDATYCGDYSTIVVVNQEFQDKVKEQLIRNGYVVQKGLIDQEPILTIYWG